MTGSKLTAKIKSGSYWNCCFGSLSPTTTLLFGIDQSSHGLIIKIKLIESVYANNDVMSRLVYLVTKCRDWIV